MTYQEPVYGKYSIAQMNLGRMVLQCVADSARWFPGEAQSVANLTLCLAGEVGEIANLVKKVTRGSLTFEEATDPSFMGEDGESTLQEEIVDVLIYLCNLMGHESFKDIDWHAIWNGKREYNEQRFGRHTLNHEDSDRWTGGDRKDEM